MRIDTAPGATSSVMRDRGIAPVPSRCHGASSVIAPASVVDPYFGVGVPGHVRSAEFIRRIVRRGMPTSTDGSVYPLLELVTSGAGATRHRPSGACVRGPSLDAMDRRRTRRLESVGMRRS